jgi:hypothetical protein
MMPAARCTVAAAWLAALPIGGEAWAADAASRDRWPAAGPYPIVGNQLRNWDDEKLGTVADVVIDAGSGVVVYALVSRGILGRGDVAVPWSALRAANRADLLMLDVPRTVLQAAPAFEPTADPVRGERIRTAIESYWREHRREIGPR